MDGTMPLQHYRSSIGVSTNYIDVIPKHVHLHKGYVRNRFETAGTTKTLFREVEIVPLEELCASDEALADVVNTQRTVEETKGQFIERMLETFKQVVYEAWDPNMFHVHLHSSGYDSRLLSCTIKELYEEHGSGWLGDIIFLCSGWEADEFMRIMEYEGWDKSQYGVPVQSDVRDTYYDESLVRFSGAWKWSNGASPLPVNLFWYLVEFAQMLGWVPCDNVQTFSSQFSTAISMRSADELLSVQRKMYWSIMRTRPILGDDVVEPYTSYALAKAILQSSVVRGQLLRKDMLKALNHDLYTEFENIHATGGRGHPIADWIIDFVYECYDASWYGTVVCPEERLNEKSTEFQPFWSHWTAASLCAHLRNLGHTIGVIE